MGVGGPGDIPDPPTPAAMRSVALLPARRARPDEAEVRDRCRTYYDAFPDAEVLYAAKAFLCRAMAHWTDEEGLGLDVCSASHPRSVRRRTAPTGRR